MAGNNNNTNKRQYWNVKDPFPVKDTAPRQRNAINLENFDTLIKQQGVRVNVYRTMYCPNVKSVDGGEHNIDCTVCNGSGFLDLHPICTQAYISAQGLSEGQNTEGFVDGNTVSATFLTGIELQYFTRVDLIDFSEPFFERVQRNESIVNNKDASVDILKYQATRVNVVSGFVTNSVTGDQDMTEFFENIDFNLDGNGNICWLTTTGARKPTNLSIYSVHYEQIIQFRATQAQHVTRFIQEPQPGGTLIQRKGPEAWQLTKEYLVKRENLFDGERTDLGQQPIGTPVQGPLG